MAPPHEEADVRLVQVTIPAGKRQAVLDALDDEGVDYVVTDETSHREYTTVVYFPLPTRAVEPVLDRLREAGLDDEAYTVVLDANTVISRRFERLAETYAEDEGEDRIAREELRTSANELLPDRWVYAAMTALSAIVATAGLLIDSPAVVVGSMVIAPLVGPALAASVGTVIDDHELFSTGVKLQLLGGGLAVVSAALFALLIRTAHLVPPGLDVLAIDEVRERLAPDFLALAIALCAGVAGALSFSTGISTALVGVMIAAALVPPAAVVGIGIAWGLPTVVVGSAVLVLVNLASINLAALAVLWYEGYRPRSWFRTDEAKSQTRRGIVALTAGILVLSVFLGAITYTSLEHAETQNAIRGEVEGVLDEPRYDDLELIEVTVVTDDRPLFYRPQEVIVVVGRPAGRTTPALVDELGSAIDGVTSRTVELEVRYVDVDRR